jgi:pyruvate dehydrogenase E1 component alpha subunit
LIEALTYRLSDHTTADDASRYRSGQEVKHAWALEPLLRIREFLIRGAAWDAAKEHALLEDCAQRVDAAVTEYLAAPKPSTDAMFDHLFAELPAHLREQRLIARRYGSKSSGH